MITFLKANIGTILVLLVVIAVVTAIIVKLVKDKKSGKGCSCSGDCSKCHGCPHGDIK
ncbi:MAG: FeoB-associated Cys-rich membrane protein [Eubacterium sp.]